MSEKIKVLALHRKLPQPDMNLCPSEFKCNYNAAYPEDGLCMRLDNALYSKKGMFVCSKSVANATELVLPSSGPPNALCRS
jgi:hypothetical protein